MELENIMLRDSRFRKAKVPFFLCYVDDRSKYKHHRIYVCIQNMFPIAGQLEKSKGGGKEENDRVSNIDSHHCVEPRHNDMH
jgi:hypothetical protein